MYITPFNRLLFTVIYLTTALMMPLVVLALLWVVAQAMGLSAGVFVATVVGLPSIFILLALFTPAPTPIKPKE